MILVRTEYSLNKDHQHHTDDSRKSHGRYIKDSKLFKTSSRRNIRFKEVKMEDAPTLLKIPVRNVQTFGSVYHDTKWPKSWSSLEDPVVPLEKNLYGHPLAGLLWERQCEKILLKYGWEKVSNWECLFVHREKGLFLSVYVDDIKLAGKKQNINPMWKVLNKEVDLGEPTSFLDHVYMGCTQRECQIRKDIVNNYISMFESRISAGAMKQKPKGNLMPKRYLHGPVTWKGMLRNVWKGFVSWQTKRLNNSTKYLLHALMTITSKKKN